jgi:hypothetical protein
MLCSYAITGCISSTRCLESDRGPGTAPGVKPLEWNCAMGYGPADSMADAAISGVRRHYDSIWQETADGAPVAAKVFQLCWISSLWNAGAGSRKKLYPLPTPFLGIFVYFVWLPRKTCYHPHAEATRSLGSVYRPRNASLEPPRLVVLKLPNRFVVTPNYELCPRTRAQQPAEDVAVQVPEMVERHWLY